MSFYYLNVIHYEFPMPGHCFYGHSVTLTKDDLVIKQDDIMLRTGKRTDVL